MINIVYNESAYELLDGESVLDCLLRHDLAIPHSCKIGSCQSCLLKCIDGNINNKATDGLSFSYSQAGYFLACQCQPKETLHIALPDIVDASTQVKVRHIRPLSETIIEISLQPLSEFTCLPGQYVSVINPENIVRCYSVANSPSRDGFITLHIRLHPQGEMSQWFANHAVIGSHLFIRGPAGTCCYAHNQGQAYPIYLAGVGTGLSPLLGILQDALDHHHQGVIMLYHAGRNLDDLYQDTMLRELEQQYDNFHYKACIRGSDTGNSDILNSDIEDALLADLSNPEQSWVFACGKATFVNKLKKQVFLKGVPSAHIFGDAFVERSHLN